MRPSYSNEPPSKKQEGAGNAGCALHPRPPVQQESTGVSNQGYTATAGIPCTMVLTVSFVISSVTMLGCHRRSRKSASLAPASERQDHTTSPSARALFVRAMIALQHLAAIASRSQRP